MSSPLDRGSDARRRPISPYATLGGLDRAPSSVPFSDPTPDYPELETRSNWSAARGAMNATRQQGWLRELGVTARFPHDQTVMSARGIRSGSRVTMGNDPKGAREQPLSTQLRDYDSPGPFGNTVTKEGPSPTHLYRGMGEEEFQQAKTRGFIRSDERGAIEPGWEGTNAGFDPATAHVYLPRQGQGRIVKMAVHPDDKWFASTHDDYARTRSNIPWSRVVAHTSALDKEQ